jgi:hypothetical protein
MWQAYFWIFASEGVSELWTVRTLLEGMMSNYRWWQIALIVGIGLTAGLASGLLVRLLLNALA